MKKLLLFIALLCCIAIHAYAANDQLELHKKWLVDSYKYGKEGNDCSNIYYEYGIPSKWTFDSDDPSLLEILHDACKQGEQDILTGHNRLPSILRSFNAKR
jgi:hypothetical protein